MSKAEAATRRTVRAMERTAKVDFATIQGGLFSPGGLSKSNQMRAAMEGLGLSMKKMSADEAASIRQRGQSLAQFDPNTNGLYGIGMSRGVAGVKEANSGNRSLLESAIKVELAMQGARIAINGSVIGAKMLTGELKGIRNIAEQFKTLPIIGNVIGAGLEAYSYAKGEDLKDAQKAEAQRQQRLFGAAGAAGNVLKKDFMSSARSNLFDAAVAGMTDRQAGFAGLANTRDNDIQAARDRLEELKNMGTVSKDVIKAEREAELAIIEKYNAEALKLDRKFWDEDEQARVDAYRAETEQLVAHKEWRERLEDMAATARERIGDMEMEAKRNQLTEQLSITSSQNLGTMTGFANPNVAVSGQFQRTQSSEGALAELAKQEKEKNEKLLADQKDLLRQILDTLRQDSSVRVGNN